MRLATLKEQYPDIANRLAKQFIDEISQLVGIVCFSRHSKSILMWSHYANAHRGFVIGSTRKACWLLWEMELSRSIIARLVQRSTLVVVRIRS